jgi:hypothetical protein
MLSSDELELLAALTLLFGYSIAGVLLAGGKQTLASWLAIISGVVAALMEIAGIVRRIRES